MRKKYFFLFSFQNFFDFWATIFQTFSQKTSRNCENYLLRVHRNNLWLYNFLKSFEPFWIFYRNLWHGSQNSIYVSRVKIAGKKFVFVFFSEFFSNFERKFFRLSAKKLQENVITTFCVSRGTICSLKFFFKSFESFRIFCRNLWHGSQKSIYVSRVKIAEKQFFLFPFKNFFDFWAKISQTFGKKTSRKCENYFCVSTSTSCGLITF